MLKHHHVKAALDVVRAAELSAADIQEDTQHIMTTLEPVNNLSVLLIHASEKTPDENVRRIAETVFAFSNDHHMPLKTYRTRREQQRVCGKDSKL